MKGKDLKVFLEAVEMLEREKGIPKETLLETIEQALLAAYKKLWRRWKRWSSNR